METIPALLANTLYTMAMKATPDDPAMFELYWKDVSLDNYQHSLTRYNKHGIVRYLLNKKAIDESTLEYMCSIATYQYNGELSLAVMHILDKYPENCKGKPQKAFCKARLRCRKIALAVLCVGKLKKDYRDISAIIARIVWGARGYCKMETEIIKIKRFRI